MTDAPAVRPPAAPVIHPSVQALIDDAVAARVDVMFADFRDAQDSCLRSMSRFTQTMALFDRALTSAASAVRSLSARVDALERDNARLKSISHPPDG